MEENREIIKFYCYFLIELARKNKNIVILKPTL